MIEKMAYSIDEAAKALSISRSAMKDLLYTGKIDSTFVGRKRLIPHWALVEFLIRGPHSFERSPVRAQSDADGQILSIINNLAMASPHIRRQFWRVMQEELGTIESVLPLRFDSPKRDLIYPEPAAE